MDTPLFYRTNKRFILSVILVMYICSTRAVMNIDSSSKRKSATVILFNKPYGVLTQFTDVHGRSTLKDYIDVQEVYPAGRLDKDSEGLVILTSDGGLQHDISHPRNKLEKTYWIQVEGIPDETALKQLQNGVRLRDCVTRPARVSRIDEPSVWTRQPAVRHRAHIPTSWLEIKIKEGKNRQIRRMTAAVGFPTLRLIRIAIGPWTLGELSPGMWKSLSLKRELA
jgi:23S rRNA pseudouridine2457 synthase